MGKYLLHGMVCGSSTYLTQCRVAQIAKREQRLSAFQLPVLPTVLSYPQSAREFECLKKGRGFNLKREDSVVCGYFSRSDRTPFT